ncbi:MAG: hypothetical protein SNI49_08410 [Rikenellaceae bacterium]
MRSISKYRLWRGDKLTNRLSRLRHYRGHGVHSPYVYSIVRNILMNRSLQSENIKLLEELTKFGVSTKTATEITNIAAHCNLNSISIDNSQNADFIICSENCTEEKIEKMANEAAQNGIAIVILSPYKKVKICNTLLLINRSTSIDRFTYLIFLNNHLPKQHFKL